MNHLSTRIEDYLEAIFSLEVSGEKQTVTALSKLLGLTKGTITTVIKKMTEQELVTHESYGAICLTNKGRDIGWKVYMKHKRLVSFFCDFLGEEKESAEESACLIEHHLNGSASNRFFNLVSFLLQAKEQKKDWSIDLQKHLNSSFKPISPLPLFGKKEGVISKITGNEKTKETLNLKGINKGCFIKDIHYIKAQNEYQFTMDEQMYSLPFNVAITLWIND